MMFAYSPSSWLQWRPRNSRRKSLTSRSLATKARARGEGEGPQGDAPQGDTPQGDTPQGDTPQGDTPQGESGQGTTGGTGIASDASLAETIDKIAARDGIQDLDEYVSSNHGSIALPMIPTRIKSDNSGYSGAEPYPIAADSLNTASTAKQHPAWPNRPVAGLRGNAPGNAPRKLRPARSPRLGSHAHRRHRCLFPSRGNPWHRYRVDDPHRW
jgi:hypothetical protein